VGSWRDEEEGFGESEIGEDASGEVMSVTDDLQLPRDSQEVDRDVEAETDIGIKSFEGTESIGVGVLQSGDC